MRKALDEVPGSKLLSVGLRQLSGPRPVWFTRVAAKDGTVYIVRVDASLGGVVGTAVPPGQAAAGKARTAALVASAKVLPEEAVDKVAPEAAQDPHFGKVTAVRLEKGRADRTVWSVTVATVQSQPTHTYQVDALTKEVVASRSNTSRPAT
ncbi:PepSY domain-containing protein [Streptomyces sp. 7R007]